MGTTAIQRAESGHIPFALKMPTRETEAAYVYGKESSEGRPLPLASKLY